jgi:hypothetical protein
LNQSGEDIIKAAGAAAAAVCLAHGGTKDEAAGSAASAALVIRERSDFTEQDCWYIGQIQDYEENEVPEFPLSKTMALSDSDKESECDEDVIIRQSSPLSPRVGGAGSGLSMGFGGGSGGDYSRDASCAIGIGGGIGGLGGGIGGGIGGIDMGGGGGGIMLGGGLSDSSSILIGDSPIQPPDFGVGVGVGGSAGLDSLIVLSSELRVQDEDNEKSKRKKERQAERECRRAAKRAAKNKERVAMEDLYRKNAKREANSDPKTGREKLEIVRNDTSGSPLADLDNLWDRPTVGGRHYVQFEKVKMWLDLRERKYEFRLQKHVLRSHWQTLCR